jgi:4-hydroxybenzoate polyprenyltransferase
MSQSAMPMPRGFGRRIWDYLMERFPLHVNVPVAFFGFFSYYFLLQQLLGNHSLAITPHSVIGAVTLTSFGMLMRVFDEFKDLESDRLYFPDRPVPAGRVQLRDLKILGWILAGSMVLLNARMGFALGAFALLMAYALLTYKYFFLPELHARSLPLTLATHSPLTALSMLYALAVCLDDFRLPLSAAPPAAWLGIPMFWLLVIAWETSRKIRVPAMEDGYSTYSKVFGPRGAAVLPMACLTVSFAIAQSFAFDLGWSFALRGTLALAFVYAMGGFVRWLLKQTPAHAKLLPFVEGYSLLFNLALFLEFGIRLGFYWRG